MNIFSFFLLSLCLIIALGESHHVFDSTLTLNEIKTKLLAAKNDDSEEDLDVISKFITKTNQTCVDQMLNIEKYGRKKVKILLGFSAVRMAAALCYENPNELFGNYFDNFVEIVRKDEDQREKVDCYKLKLKEIEPNSELLNGLQATRRIFGQRK